MKHLKVIVGLGNIGTKYTATRHNVGQWFLDACLHQHGCKWADHGTGVMSARTTVGDEQVYFIKTKSYMNVSGLPIKRFCEYYDTCAAQMLVAYDDIDLACGSVRLKQGGGHGGHNGLRDIMAHGLGDCWRLRLGVGRPPAAIDTSNYVLGLPGQEDKKMIESAIGVAVDALPELVAGGFDLLMNSWHQK